ncbi:DNA polymerase III subunit beta [Mesoplasma lactucae]|uniref:Beta sliding clamp n=1 Tax=Mesoplasma lactucae ATCC 49193 TaxID=81460 RepID=A0A291ISM1_9MOLU|nr:DNA polymerase III subunit beta [Mesoplasma lactucae]ATG97706.1 DNA polymerase III subunit beta [Mesoplasma lactucae ATCC 49193]ATZ19827.1 DNA polymerase III subunit beta [Mesoplasma lactucae ATCC 49193]MCL8216690.1 Beta sliding clamp [Mesoplasma lactucae ATCC 49193]
MKLKMTRSILLDEISKANKIIDPKAVNPELLGVYISVENDSITLLSSNGNMNWKARVNKSTDENFEVESVGNILIKGRFLIEVLRKIDDEIVELSKVENNELVIKTSKVRFNLQILDAESYPLIGFRETGAELEINPKELKKAIQQTMVSVDEYNKKLIFTGMNFQGKQGDSFLKVFTTDSYRISTKKLNLKSPLNEDIEFTITYKTLNELIRLLDGANELKMYILDGYITFDLDHNALFQTTLIEGKYPNVERAFPDNFETKLVIERQKIIKALGRANLTSEEGMTPIVTLEIDDDKIDLSSNSPDVGNYSETLTGFEFEGKEQKISFNIKYLLDAFRTFEDDKVSVNLISSVKPLEIENTTTDKSLRQLVLPLSIG